MVRGEMSSDGSVEENDLECLQTFGQREAWYLLFLIVTSGEFCGENGVERLRTVLVNRANV